MTTCFKSLNSNPDVHDAGPVGQHHVSILHDAGLGFLEVLDSSGAAGLIIGPKYVPVLWFHVPYIITVYEYGTSNEPQMILVII